MKTEDLKTGFWGYRKFSVYQYITELEENFSTRLLEQEEETKRLLEAERERARQLEEELNRLRKEYEDQKQEQMLIASTLMEAQRYAERLRAESEEERQTAQQRLEEEEARQNGRLERYADDIDRLRELLRTMLQEMDASAEQLARTMDQVRPEPSEGNLSLFRRRPELVV